LTRPSEFKQVFANSKRVGDEYFSVLGHNNQLAFARLGLGVAKKHIKQAVGRNRVKRLLRESFRQHQDELSGLDIVVLLRRDVTVLDNADIYKRFNKLWQAISKKCKPS
jgi:ribonuclease P protein component